MEGILLFIQWNVLTEGHKVTRFDYIVIRIYIRVKPNIKHGHKQIANTNVRKSNKYYIVTHQ